MSPNGTQNGHHRPTAPSISGPMPSPHNLEAERAVLGAMLLDNDVIDLVMQEVEAGDFYQPEHRLIFAAIHRLVDAGAGIGGDLEIVRVAEELRKSGGLDAVPGGTLYLSSLEQSVLTTSAAPELAAVVREAARSRRILALAGELTRAAHEGAVATEEQVSRGIAALEGVISGGKADAMRPIGSIVAESLDAIDNPDPADASIPTGFPNLDSLLPGGGLPPRGVFVLAGRPRNGKTAFAMQMAVQIASRDTTPVAVFSVEEGAEDLIMRIVSSQARIKYPSLMRGPANLEPHHLAMFRSAMRRIAELPLYVDETPGLSISAFKARARVAVRRLGARVIMLDYVQLLTDERLVGKDIERVSEASAACRTLARELGVSVVALSQMSRNVDNRGDKVAPARPRCSDLRGSGTIEQDASIVMFLHSEHGTGGSFRVVEGIVDKNRKGAKGDILFGFHGDEMRFGQMDRGEAERHEDEQLRVAIVREVKKAQVGIGAKEIAELINRRQGEVGAMLRQMLADGWVELPGSGTRYYPGAKAR